MCSGHYLPVVPRTWRVRSVEAAAGEHGVCSRSAGRAHLPSCAQTARRARVVAAAPTRVSAACPSAGSPRISPRLVGPGLARRNHMQSRTDWSCAQSLLQRRRNRMHPSRNAIPALGRRAPSPRQLARQRCAGLRGKRCWPVSPQSGLAIGCLAHDRGSNRNVLTTRADAQGSCPAAASGPVTGTAEPGCAPPWITDRPSGCPARRRAARGTPIYGVNAIQDPSTAVSRPARRPSATTTAPDWLAWQCVAARRPARGTQIYRVASDRTRRPAPGGGLDALCAANMTECPRHGWHRANTRGRSCPSCSRAGNQTLNVGAYQRIS